MVKFAVVVIFAILAAVQYAEGINMNRCAQLAISQGVPALSLPSHNPLRVTRNITVHYDSLMGSEFTFVLDNIVWTNLPWWDVVKNSVTKNTSEVMDAEGALWYNNFTISFDYDYQWGSQHLEGNIEFYYEDVTWDVDWEETKPDASGVRVINYLNLHQKIGKRSIKTTGFGLLTFIAENLLLALSDIGNEAVVNNGNLFGTTFGGRINEVWYGKPAYYNKLVDWCVSQNVTDY